MSASLTPLERKQDARNGHVRFEERGVETEWMAGYSGTGNRKGRSQLWPRLITTAPLLDSTNSPNPSNHASRRSMIRIMAV